MDSIENAIPHRKPMLLVDAIIGQSDVAIRCRKTFHADEFFVQGHFPGKPIVPGVILCECALQSGAILVSHKLPQGEPFVPVATRIDGAKFKRMVQPGDTIDIEVTLNETLSNAYFMTGKITVDGKLAARLDFACSIVSGEL